MNIDISLTLCMLVPKAEYYGSLSNNTEESYNNIIWKDSRTKPTWQEIVDNSELAFKMFMRQNLIVTPLQLIRALILTDEYENLIYFLSQASPEIQIGWERSVEIPRLDPFVNMMLQILEKTDEEADMIFALAETL